MNVFRQIRRDQAYELSPWQTNGDTLDCNDTLCQDMPANQHQTKKKVLPLRLPMIPVSNFLIENIEPKILRRMLKSTIADRAFDASKAIELRKASQRKFPASDSKIDRTKENNSSQRVLQEVIVKNFIIEGSWQNHKGQQHCKKKQSSFVMKQKFAEIRRSLNLVSNKENCIMRVIRYDG